MCGMSTVAENKAAIDQLSPEERCELEALLHPWEDNDWDRQMKSDATAGKFRVINRDAYEAHKKGEMVPLSDILHEP